ncbi:CHAD domain-containing protein [Chitinophaga filiformis]|uniref:CHAD domain-containing protein n=1 Tax=Chitinophaga filiformis TaxID=104663 RepID=A0A1G7TTN8_CHIFI|nr:CHAD domain-containing protein [Chitinophaga filiformis]SDG38069.1 CHAD domain-containing protein [Chitinophaga filiformis]
MLKRKRQQKYLVKRCLELRLQLYAFADAGGEDALHKLRVEIKKLKAFSKLTKLYKGEKAVTIKKNIRKIFHRAGIIREASINLQMIKQFNIHHPAFNTEAKGTIQQETAKFRLHKTDYNDDIRNNVKSFLKSLQPVRNHDIKHWFTRQLKKIAGVVTTTSTDQLHEARKRIKNLVYMHGILQQRLASALELNIDYLDQMQDAIGKWHDTAVAVELLAAHSSGNKAKISKLHKEQDKAGKAIHTMGDDFLNKVVKRD